MKKLPKPGTAVLEKKGGQTMNSKLKPCPLCGAKVKVHGPEDWRPTFYDPDSGGDPVSIDCECGMSFSIGSYDYQETYMAWNHRAGEEGKHETV